MAFKTVTYKVIGMHQDLSESARDNKYSFENMNIRIDARNNNTLLSIENERGNLQITNIKVWGSFSNTGAPYSTLNDTIATLPFIVLGQVVIDKYLVLFGKDSSTRDIIVRLEYISTGTFTGWNMIYFYKNRGLNFSLDNPIEALANIETEKIKKVYWVDGLNEPRVINICNSIYMNNSDIYSLTSALDLNEDFSVIKDLSQQGNFPQGKVQYCYTYYNDTDTESNIIDYSPLFDLTELNNGVAPNVTSVNTSGVFNITIGNLDTSFKYVKIYCLIFKDLYGIPVVSSIPKITIPQSSNASISIIDTYKGHLEESVTFVADSTASRQSFIPYTLGVKDNTLFFGNIKLNKPSVENIEFHFGSISSFLKTIGEEKTSDAVYQYKPSLTTFKGSNFDYKGFKKYNWYRLGFIAQYKTGEWSDVIYLGDAQCLISSETTIQGESIIPKIPNFRYTFSTEDFNTLQNLYDSGYRKIKPVCVVPNTVERTVVAQGIVSPTVYKGGNRVTSGYPFAQASWFFRPTLIKSPLVVDNYNFKPIYPYTLRDQEDFLSTNTVATATTWWKHDIATTVSLSWNYREYRHAFSLPPKDRINAELESSDASLNAYFIYKDGSLNIFADDAITIKYGNPITPLLTDVDAHFIGREVTPGTHNITYATASKVLLPNKEYKITGYKNTIFVDESIVTFNSPEIDYSDIIGNSAPLDLSSSNMYLNISGAAQITSSYSNTDIESNDLPADSPEEYKLFSGGRGWSIYNLNKTNNEHLDNINKIIKYTNGNSGYNPILAGPWWYEWIYALGFVKKTGSADQYCIEPPYEINHALGIKSPSTNDHYVLRTATGSLSTHFKQSWSGQLHNSGGADRATISFAQDPTVANQHYLTYGLGEDKAPLATHTFVSKDQGPNENYPDDGNMGGGGKPYTVAFWYPYGLAASVKQNPYSWMWTYIFANNTPLGFLTYSGFDAVDTFNRSVLYRPNGVDSFYRKGYAPAGDLASSTAVDYNVKNPYGCHLYSNSEVNFPHSAFERYYPHIIYPFMANNRPLNGNTILYESPIIPVPKIKRTTNLLYSKNTIYNNNLNNTGAPLVVNINPSLYSHTTVEDQITVDWLEGVYDGNSPITYQGSFTTGTLLNYTTHHLISALRWYRGFNTLNSTPTEGVESVSKILNLETFTKDVLFAGFLKPLYKKSGYMQVVSLDFSTDPLLAEYSDNNREYDDFNTEFDNPLSSFVTLGYLSTPHIVSSYKLDNNYVRILPKLVVNTITNDEINYNDPASTFTSEYYCKEFVKHIGTLGEVEASNTLSAGVYNAIYPHTGCWAKIYPDQTSIIQSSSNKPYQFWLEGVDSQYHYGVTRDEITIPIENIMLQADSRVSRLNPEKVGFLHIGEYINVNNFHESPYDNNNVDLYDWLPCGNSYKIADLLTIMLVGKDAYIDYLEGDIYFQRYNCLKTSGQAKDNEEFNAIVEHASVYIESYINLDGRYDQNIYSTLDGIQKKTTYIDTINPVYSRVNNFFTYYQRDYTLFNSGLQHFPTAIIWSLPKIYGENIDSWSVVPMSSIYYVDGISGDITSLKNLGNNLVVFQQHGVSVVDFNSKALIQTDTLAPIAIITHNAIKMQGVTYVSKQVGTYNKFSIVETNSGLVFIDNTLQCVFKMDSSTGIENLSDALGMMLWTHQNMVSTIPWSVSSFYSSTNSSFTGYYDKVFNDVYFTNKDYCLVYNEKLNAFTSFYSYQGVPYMINYQDELIATYNNSGGAYTTSLWKQHKGGYNLLFGERVITNYMDIVVNENLLYDKVFNFIEFYYECYKEDISRPLRPYTILATDVSGFSENQIASLEAYNEYQYGILHTNLLNLRQKYRTWRMELPRDSVRKLERMRGPWVHVKLNLKNNLNLRQVLHSISVNYTLPIQPLKEN